MESSLFASLHRINGYRKWMNVHHFSSLCYHAAIGSAGIWSQTKKILDTGGGEYEPVPNFRQVQSDGPAGELAFATERIAKGLSVQTIQQEQIFCYSNFLDTSHHSQKTSVHKTCFPQKLRMPLKEEWTFHHLWDYFVPVKLNFVSAQHRWQAELISAPTQEVW